jgi:hypothetical protein
MCTSSTLLGGRTRIGVHVGAAILTKRTARTLHADGVVVKPSSIRHCGFDTSMIMRASDESRLVNEFVRASIVSVLIQSSGGIRPQRRSILEVRHLSGTASCPL